MCVLLSRIWSGENSSNWSNYFYIVTWWNNATSDTLYSQIQADIGKSNVPVVAEVNAHLMPNRPHNGAHTNHFISIIGWNDLYHNSDGSYGAYSYTDTCGSSTLCGSNTDGGVHTVPYNDLWTAITNIGVNQSTGDGGWVW